MGVIEQRHIDAAKRAGACSAAYIAGDPFSCVTWSDAVWFEDELPQMAAEIFAAEGLPVWALAGSGSGSGSGSGYGYGAGDGSGSGSGDSSS